MPSTHKQLAAVGFGVMSAIAAYHIGDSYGWSGDSPGTVDNFGVILAIIGFVVAVLCLLSIPMNRVAWARLAVGGLFTAYAYLSLVSHAGWGWTLLYAVVALWASWRIVLEGLETEDGRP